MNHHKTIITLRLTVRDYRNKIGIKKKRKKEVTTKFKKVDLYFYIYQLRNATQTFESLYIIR